MVRSFQLVTRYVRFKLCNVRESGLLLPTAQGGQSGYTASHPRGNRQLTPLGALSVWRVDDAGKI